LTHQKLCKKLVLDISENVSTASTTAIFEEVPETKYISVFQAESQKNAHGKII
jgi:hypothetical protein